MKKTPGKTLGKTQVPIMPQMRVKATKTKRPVAPPPQVLTVSEPKVPKINPESMKEVLNYYSVDKFVGTRYCTPSMMGEFLICLAATANITKSAKLVGAHREQLYMLKVIEPDFAAAWAKATIVGTAALEDEATRRGFEGIDKAVFYQGIAVAMVKEYSDNLLQFILRTRDPDRYKDRTTTELTGAASGPIQNVNFNTADPNEAAMIYEQLMGAGSKKK